jgi:hypothetical protein
MYVIGQWRPVASSAPPRRDDRGTGCAARRDRLPVTFFATGQDPLGATIRIQNVPFQVICMLSVKGADWLGTGPR